MSHAAKYIWVTFQRPGFHNYPTAPNEVAYLQSRHRHLFKFKVKIQVFHDDREIEFHMCLNEIESWYNTGALELNHKSCEMMADDLYEKLTARYHGRSRLCVIEVSEDGECGCECHYVL